MGNILYGIHNCDRVKKARNWLQSNKIDYNFHDVRKDGIDKTLMEKILTPIKWDILIDKADKVLYKAKEKGRNNICFAHQNILSEDKIENEEKINN